MKKGVTRMRKKEWMQGKLPLHCFTVFLMLALRPYVLTFTVYSVTC